MWPEPLAASTRELNPYSADVRVRDASGALVAHVRIGYNRDFGTGYYGEMQIDDPAGGPRQKVRALVLLTREALRHAQEIGLTSVATDAPPRLAAFAARMCGFQPSPRGDGVRFAGALYAARSAALDASDPDGNFTADPPDVTP